MSKIKCQAKKTEKVILRKSSMGKLDFYKMTKRIVAIMFFATVPFLSAKDMNTLDNPDFEGKVQSPWYGKFEKCKKQGLDNSACIRLQNGNYIAYKVPNKIAYKFPNKGALGRFYKFTAMVKGKGSIELSVYATVPSRDGKRYEYQKSSIKTKELSGEWEKIQLEGQEKSAKSIYNRIMVRSKKGTNVLIDNVDFHYTTDLKITPLHVTAYPGEQVIIKASVLKNSTRNAGIPVQFTLLKSIRGSRGKVKESEKSTGEDGTVKYKVNIPENFSSGVIRLKVLVPETGQFKNCFISVFPKGKIDSLNKTATKIKLNKNMYILYLGDSLTDAKHGYNYVYMVNYFLNKYNPGMATFRNAGVGGDYIPRVNRRLQGKWGERMSYYQQYRYEHLLNPKPNIIFIFLGHNDSKVGSPSNYQKPLVPPNLQYKEYKKLINFLRKRTKAQIVFISTTSSYLAPQLKKAERLSKIGRKHSLFGLDKHLINFNNTLKKLAQEENIDYVDVYTITKNYPDKKSLFVSDGVHMTDNGHVLVTGKILEYLQGKYPKRKNSHPIEK